VTGVQYPGQAVVYQLAGDGTRLGEKEAPTALQLGAGGFEALTEPTSNRAYGYGPQGGLASVTEVSGPVPLPVVSYELDAAGRPTRETRGADVKTFGWDGAGRLRSSPVLCVNRTSREAPRILQAALATTTSFDFSRDMSR
jgi:YD repeat-containing protein